MEYNFRDIEKKWQDEWKKKGVYKVSNDPAKPKCYVLDMFPYPSGAGLHVGHPLGYIASDIYARYKRLKGFNVLHPMGYDAFGLPAEQYAIDHGIHPAVSTENNIKNFRNQLDKIGFCFDWDREVNTSKPEYYKWTQWIFLQLFDSFYNRQKKKAEPVSQLIAAFEKDGNKNHPVPDSKFEARLAPSMLNFSAAGWKAFDEKTRQDLLMEYRLAYCGIGEVNWCEALGTVLANDEVINGVSERGGHPVVKKKLRQWYLRITEYADRLLDGLQKVDFSEAMKEMQSNWIGKSSGAEIIFSLNSSKNIEGLTPNPSPGREGNSEESTASGNFFQTADKKNWGILKDLSRENRKNKTEAEDVLWQELRNNQLGHKVRRQHVIDGFIIDFAFLQKRLLIEIDAGYHSGEEQKIYDKARTEYLTELGYEVLRFMNDEVIKNKDSVIEKIKKELERPLAEGSDSPLSVRRGVRGEALKLKVYTTRPDTIFGVDFMVIAPEHELVEQITTAGQKNAVEEYIAYVKSRSERERMAEKKLSGVFTGAYALNPFNGRAIPIWISEYVLAGYGTGAIMGVPCGDERDHRFAKQFGIPITNIIGNYYNGEEANPTYDAKLENSDFLNGIEMRKAAEIVIAELELAGLGKRKINYKMRDAAFSRQRYWGEPFPIVWKNARLNDAVGQGIAYPLDESELPLKLPEVDSYKPGPEGEGPLANIPEWTSKNLETNTMPGYAGSSWYFLRYMDPHNDKEFCNRKISDYWNQVDLYIGGTEHAVGHLLYSRMWTKCLFDLGLIGFDEPYKKLVNQGMIQGSSRFVYRLNIDYLIPFDYENDKHPLVFVSRDIVTIIEKQGLGESDKLFLSKLYEELNGFSAEPHFVSFSPIRVDVNFVDGYILDRGAFAKWKAEFANSHFILQDNEYFCGGEVEKMSKSKFNTVNPDDLVVKYGADTFRMYEMFLGPVEMSKPWDTKGIEGVHRFLKKLWRLFFKESLSPSSGGGQGEALWTEEKATAAELKVLHKTIKKIEEDTERFSFNTGVSAFMICVNELTDIKCHKKEVLESLLILLTPYAPHISEELWNLIGNKDSIVDASYPKFEEKYIAETSKEYPVSINGKLRTTMNFSLEADQSEVERIVIENEIVKKWLEGKSPKKIIFVKNKMINVVI